MWFKRVISWIRGLFSALDDANELPYEDALGYDPLPRMSEPEFTRRQLLYPRDPIKNLGLGPSPDTLPLPQHYESPKTIPLFRLTQQMDLRFDEPTQALHVSSEPPAPLASREPAQPIASEPLPASLQRLSEAPDSPDTFEHLDDFDELTRRLLFLRRLVRQRVYNEGFAASETPAQYRHSLGLSDQPADSGSQN